MRSEQQQEHDIQAAGGTAPRLTPADIVATIDSVHYFTAAEGVYGAEEMAEPVKHRGVPAALKTLTICVLVLKNGFTVTGESACASPENFNAEIGQRLAYEKAREKIWALEGYLLKQRLHNGS